MKRETESDHHVAMSYRKNELLIDSNMKNKKVYYNAVIFYSHVFQGLSIYIFSVIKGTLEIAVFY